LIFANFVYLREKIVGSLLQLLFFHAPKAGQEIQDQDIGSSYASNSCIQIKIYVQVLESIILTYNSSFESTIRLISNFSRAPAM